MQGLIAYIFKLFQAAFLREGLHVPTAPIVSEVKKSLSFFSRIVSANCGNLFEHQVLAYVINANKPVNPREVARAVGLPTIKPVADTLCALGLVGR